MKGESRIDNLTEEEQLKVTLHYLSKLSHLEISQLVYSVITKKDGSE